MRWGLRKVAYVFLFCSIALVAVQAAGALRAPAAASQPVPHSAASFLKIAPVSSSAYMHVVRVIDGDTFVVEEEAGDVVVRVIGIDTPEVVDPRKPVECFGTEASNEAHRVLDDASVRLVRDPSQDEYDKYHRLLAYVYLPDGTLYNLLMIEQGFAHEYTYRKPYQLQQQFRAAEADARQHERGLWSPSTCRGETGVLSKPVGQ